MRERLQGTKASTPRAFNRSRVGLVVGTTYPIHGPLDRFHSTPAFQSISAHRQVTNDSHRLPYRRIGTDPSEVPCRPREYYTSSCYERGTSSASADDFSPTRRSERLASHPTTVPWNQNISASVLGTATAQSAMQQLKPQPQGEFAVP